MELNIKKTSVCFLFFLVILYYSQGVLYSNNHIIAKISLLLFLGISFFYFIKFFLLKKIKDMMFISISLFILLNTFGFLSALDFSEVYIFQYKNMLITFLPFFPIYYLASKGYIDREKIIYMFFLIFPIFVALFYSYEKNIVDSYDIKEENVVNNIGYYFLSIMPYTFLIKRKYLSISTFFLLFYFIILSSKRGALILAVLALIVFLVYQFKNIERKKIIQSIIVSIVGLILFLKISFNQFIQNEYLISRLQRTDDGGSGRDVIYTNLWLSWYNSDNLINYLFGFGFLSSTKFSGNGDLAHNDWLELLINFGILGVVIYLMFFISIFKAILVKKLLMPYKYALISFLLIAFFQTFFSMFYAAPAAIFMTILCAYILGSHEYDKKTLNRNF